jgi:hypothetical protein
MKIQIITSGDKEEFTKKVNEAEEKRCIILYETFKAEHIVIKEWEGFFYCIMVRVPAGVTL